MARRKAATLLDGVFVRGKSVRWQIGPGRVLEGCKPPVRAEAQRLAVDVLRYLGRVDRVIDSFLVKPLKPRFRNVLRIGVLELHKGDSAPYAVVNETVNLMKERARSGGFPNLANAVLRNVARDDGRLWSDAEPNRLPEWIAGPFLKAFDEELLRATERAHEKEVPLDLTPAHDRHGEELARILKGKLLTTGSIRIGRDVQVRALPHYAEGSWWVQDAAAALPVRMLGDLRGKRVLDMCAAPGSKSMQLAAAGATVTALEASEIRIRRMKQNLARTGLQVELIHADAFKWGSSQKFDIVVLDPPCSASGTLRRNPDLAHLKSNAHIGKLVKLQDRFLRHAASLVRGNGSLLYCVCSIVPDECEILARSFARNNNWKFVRPDTKRLGIDPDWVGADGGLRTLPAYCPENGGIDGFYAAHLRHRQEQS